MLYMRGLTPSQPCFQIGCLVDSSLVYCLKLINKQLETVQQEVQYALHERIRSISALLSDWLFVIPCEQAIAKSTCFHMGVESVPKGGDD